MAHRRRPGGKDRRSPKTPTPVVAMDPRREGLRAFQAGRFADAIAAWSGLSAHDARVAAALAEAHFRRALTLLAGTAQLDDLRRAVDLAPDDPRYQYHLGLALHHAHEIPAAIERYRTVLARDPTWPGVGMSLALAALEQDPAVDLAALPGSTPTVRLTLAPVQALLRGAPVSVLGDGPLERLWQGLSLLGRDSAAARVVLDDDRPLPSARAGTVRQYYQGMAAASAGDFDMASRRWRRVFAEDSRDPESPRRPWLLDNMSAAALRLLDTPPADAADDLARATDIGPDALALAANSTALAGVVIRALDRGAAVAAMTGDWAQATRLWERARDIVSAGTGLGSPRPLLHNLALAYEAQERWLEAAETWRAMLRTRPRRQAAAETRKTRGRAAPDSVAAAAATLDTGGGEGSEGVPSAAQWAWVRRRVVECYKRAGQPGEAVAIFRQALKADPDDVEMRLQLVDALLASGQEQAAYNEVWRAARAAPDDDDVQLRLAGLQLERGEGYAAERTLRQLLKRSPDHAEARRLLARVLLEIGLSLHESGQYAAAVKAFEQGRDLAPDDYQFPLGLARVAIDQGQRKGVAALLERVLELGTAQPAAYVGVLECWTVMDDIDQARAVAVRAESALPPASTFDVDAGSIVLRVSTTPARPYGRVRSPAPASAKTAWEDLGAELLERGLARRPDDARLRASVATELLPVRPALALRYAEEAARLAPDDLPVLILLGMAQGLNERGREAKETLQRAARQARRQGDAVMAREIELLRRQVDSPLLSLLLGAGSLFGSPSDEQDMYW